MMIILPIAAFVPTSLIIIAALLPVAWLYSEIDGSRWVRMLLGLLAIIMAALVVSETRLIIPTYTTHFQHFSIKQATDLLKEGQTDTVIEAFEQYLVDSTNSFRLYKPAMTLSEELTKRKKENIEHQPAPYFK